MSIYHTGVAVELALAAITFIALRFIVAPYGRHARPGWGPALPNRLAWLLMEAPSALTFAIVFSLGPHRSEPRSLALLALWELHYLHRALVFPFRLRPGKPMPVAVMVLGILFNLLNASLNGYAAAHFPPASLLALSAGAGIFVVCFWLNERADATLIRLRRSGGYAIPQGGLFALISCPNYFAETLEWCGWALASQSLAGVAFALYTFANLAPRALANHRWYREKFPEYPRQRKAFVPFLW
jgi:protein-S-isoprenylcysteine O-methyltransferase Ste14